MANPGLVVEYMISRSNQILVNYLRVRNEVNRQCLDLIGGRSQGAVVVVHTYQIGGGIGPSTI